MWFVIRTQRQFWIVAAGMAVGAAAAVAAFAFAVQYTVREWDVLAQARAELAGDEAIRRGVGQGNDALGRVADDRALLVSSFADPKDPLPFIEGIEALARRTGVRSELTLSNVDAGQYEISADGEYLRVMGMLRALEALPFLITIGDAELLSAEGSSAVRLTVAVKLVPKP